MNELKINGVYRHFKGNYYLVVDVARHSETGEEYVSANFLNKRRFWRLLREIFL